MSYYYLNQNVAQEQLLCRQEQNYIVLMNAIPIIQIATDRELFTFNEARPAPVQQSSYELYNLLPASAIETPLLHSILYFAAFCAELFH